MPFAISPDHFESDIETWTLDKKIEVFISRVKGWQLGVAQDMVSKDISHRGFASLMIVVSYFEMIGKYRVGYIGEYESRKHFKLGLMDVFPMIPSSAADVLDMFYERVRNGLYHMGMIRTRIVLSGDIEAALGFGVENKHIYINPDRLVGRLVTHFSNFATQLTNPENSELQSNFQKRFDYDNRDEQETA